METVEIDRSDVQGMLVSAYSHLKRAAYLFLQFHDAVGARQWLTQLLPSISSGELWPTGRDGKKVKPPQSINIAFTYPGLAAIGVSHKTLDSFLPPFTLGAAARAGVAGDVGESAPELWEFGGPNTAPVHAMLIVQSRSPRHLKDFEKVLDELIAASDGAVSIIATEYGYRREEAKEHFGFHDGLSQPNIAGVGVQKADGQRVTETGEFVLGYLNAYGLYPTSPIVPVSEDPHHLLPKFPEGALPDCRDFGKHGTYIVYRKLEQDVAKFWRSIQDVAESDQAEMLKIGSKYLGRWPSGTPITLSPDVDPVQYSDENDFRFMPLDPNGTRCPVGSHIRRANPRDSRVNDTPEASLNTSSRHRVLRRAMLYGDPLISAEDTEWPKAPVDLQDDGVARGLQFVVLNADIQRQFEFVQQTWFNIPTFNAEFATKDPFVGDNNGTGYMTLQAEPYRQRIPHMPRFVRTRAAAYLFMPSLTALRFMTQI